MIIGINESKTLTKHILCECKCKFNGQNCYSDQWWNNGKCWCECKKRHVCEKDYVWNPATYNFFKSVMDDSVITYEEIIETHNEETNFKTQNFYILLAFLLITIALLKLLVFTVIYKLSKKTKTFITM